MLVVNAGAGSVDKALEERLLRELPGFELHSFPRDSTRLAELDRPTLVVVCGGDGTISQVARMLTGSRHVLGVLPMGTFNNFARALGIPVAFEQALRVVRNGTPQPCTVGVADGNYFVESLLVGVLGAAVAEGERARELQIGPLMEGVRDLVGSERLHYRISGDVSLSGEASWIAAANTPTTGAHLPLAETTPRDPWLELRIDRAGSPIQVVEELVGLLLQRPPDGAVSHRIYQVRIETDPPAPVVVDGFELGRTPTEVRAWPGALRVLLPDGWLRAAERK